MWALESFFSPAEIHLALEGASGSGHWNSLNLLFSLVAEIHLVLGTSGSGHWRYICIVFSLCRRCIRSITCMWKIFEKTMILYQTPSFLFMYLNIFNLFL